MSRLIIGRLYYDKRRQAVLGRLTAISNKFCRLACEDGNRRVHKADIRQGRPRTVEPFSG